MQATLGYLRRADQEYGMIEPGDRVAVGVSGGKDSLLLLRALALYRRMRGDFTLQAVMLTMGEPPPDTRAIEALCESLSVPLTIRHTELYALLFAQPQRKSPCALCARMRRAMLCALCRELGCNKLALGHHRDDALETLLMSVLFEGRLHTFQPRTVLTGSGVTVIRPLIFMPEKEILSAQRRLSLPVLESVCPVNGHTRRQEMKQLLRDLARRYPRLQENMLAALRNDAQYGLWQKTPRTGAQEPPPEA
jgi:tRNA(Ile)-lysidine synthase TilS/MesJ